MRCYSITEAARLLGVSPATVSRRLAPERATRGRSAKLSPKELAEIATALQVDPTELRRRINVDLEFAPDMPKAALDWAATTADRQLEDALRAHQARIPEDVWLTSETSGPMGIPEPWGDAGEWTPVTSDQQLRDLVPPADR